MKENIEYEDFLPKNTFIMNWMLTYLPKSRRFQDVIVLGVGSLVSVLIGAATIDLMPEGFKHPILGLIINVIFLYDFLWRNFLAAIRYERAKRDVK